MTMNNSASLSNEELMSKLMDGEISELELHRLLKATENNDELRNTWSMMNLAESCSGEECVPVTDLSIADSVQSRLGVEKGVEHLGVVSPIQRWWKPVSQLAVAASVATLMVLVAPLVKHSTPEAVDNHLASFQSVDETVYDLNAALSLATPASQNVSTQLTSDAASLTRSDREILAGLKQQTGFIAEPMSAEEQERISRLMSEYMVLHANGAGLNTTSPVRNYLQVAPR